MRNIVGRKNSPIIVGDSKPTITNDGPEWRRQKLLAQISDLRSCNEKNAAQSDALLEHATLLVENNKLDEAERTVIAAEVVIHDRIEIYRLNRLLELCGHEQQ
jgi:hypothetical protein